MPLPVVTTAKGLAAFWECAAVRASVALHVLSVCSVSACVGVTLDEHTSSHIHES